MQGKHSQILYSIKKHRKRGSKDDQALKSYQVNSRVRDLFRKLCPTI